MKRSDVYLVLFIITVCAYIAYIRRDNISTHKNETVKTVIIRDTIRDTIPTFIDRRVVRFDTVTAFAHIIDTVIQRGRDTVTVYVPLPIERRTYHTDEYKAIIEGYKPRLVYIETYKQTEIQKVRIKPSRWGIGLQVGYGTNFTNVTPYIGIGLTYNIVNF